MVAEEKVNFSRFGKEGEEKDEDIQLHQEVEVERGTENSSQEERADSSQEETVVVFECPPRVQIVEGKAEVEREEEERHQEEEGRGRRQEEEGTGRRQEEEGTGRRQEEEGEVVGMLQVRNWGGGVEGHLLDGERHSKTHR